MKTKTPKPEPVLQAGEFWTQVVKVAGSRVIQDREHAIGYPSAEKAAEAAGMHELAFGGETAEVLVTDSAGAVRRFEVTLRIKSWGEVKEIG